MGRSRAFAETLAAISYGEWKAHVGAAEAAAVADDPVEARELKQIAAEELRHYKGFTRRLRELGHDPDELMAPYEAMLDAYHRHETDDPIEEAVWGYLGEGVADSLLGWYRTVADDETAAFIDTVIADEVEHEARATRLLNELISRTPGGRRKAGRAARVMLFHMAVSGRRAPTSLGSFLRVGRPGTLLATLVGGHVRRMAAIGLFPLGTPIPLR